ncbi:MAG: ribonuclease D [Gammaproteobacteria bacterium]
MTSRHELAELCERWSALPAIGLDTEFIRTDTFFARPGLFQVTDGKACYLVDPIAVGASEAMASLLESEAVTKVIHACGEDVELLRRFFGVIPRRVFDLQLGVAFTGGPYSVSYADLVQRYMGDAVEKDHTRSDWLQRPLTEDQLRYAAQDVEYLMPVYEVLSETLAPQQRLAWVLEESETRVSEAAETAAPPVYYRGVSGAHRLSRRRLEILRRLCRWREETARAEDRPRNRIVADKALLGIAADNVQSYDDLRASLTPRAMRRYGEILLDLLDVAAQAPESVLPEALDPPVQQRHGELVGRLREFARARAADLGLAQELIARRRLVEEFVSAHVNGRALPAKFLGWRRDVVTRDFERLVGD